MPQSVSTRTVGDVVTWVTEQFGDVASVQIDVTKIIRWINMAILEIVTKDPKANRVKLTQSSVANQQEYTYPALTMSVFSIKWDNTLLSQVSFEGIQDTLGAEYVNTTGDPMYWSEWGNGFLLWPKPTTVKTISLYCTAKPADVTTSADVIPLSDRYYPRITDFVMSKAQELDEDFQAAAATRNLFEDKLREGANAPDQGVGQNAILDDPDDYYAGDW